MVTVTIHWLAWVCLLLGLFLVGVSIGQAISEAIKPKKVFYYKCKDGHWNTRSKGKCYRCGCDL